VVRRSANALRLAAIRATVKAWNDWAEWVMSGEDADRESSLLYDFAEHVLARRWGRFTEAQLTSVRELTAEADALPEEERRVAPKLRWVREESKKLTTLYGGRA
jgi:hypothetical protein